MPPRLTDRLGLNRFEADQHYKHALEAYQKGSLSDAALEMENAIALLPNNAEYYAARGFFYLEDGVKKKAQKDLERALTIFPYEMMAHYGMGMLAYQDKKWSEAVAHFSTAHHIAPERPETLYYLALAQHHSGENPIALGTMQQAYTLLETANDKRKADALRWVKQLERLVQQALLPPPEL